MNSPITTIPLAGLDSRALSSLIVELNIARRNWRAYPAGHQVITSSLQKVLQLYNQLLACQDEIVLGVTSQALMVEGVFLDKNNLVYRDFARVLFELGIGAVLFHSKLTQAELERFTGILSLKRADVMRQGGIEQVWDAAGMSAITIRPIRYDLFSTTEEEAITSESTSFASEGLWERFARGLSQGGLGNGDSGSAGELDPAILAAALNRQFSQGDQQVTSYSQTITSFMRHSSATEQTTVPFEKLATFISHLTPDLRRQFLNCSFDPGNQVNQSAAEKVISNLSATTVLETLEDINQQRLRLPSVIMGLLQRLGRHSDGRHSVEPDSTTADDLSHKMKTIFREHASEEFVPDDYQQKLNSIIATEQIPLMQMADSATLLETLESRPIEISIGAILLNLVREGCETAEERELLVHNLRDLYGYALQTGEYDQLHAMIDQIMDDSFPSSLQQLLYKAYCCRENLEEILDGLKIWGKPRYEDIRLLIHKIGHPFIELLLNRLSEESSMSIRRFFTTCLIAMGSPVVTPVLNRLGDSRWYFLRNLLNILQALGDPGTVPQIRTLLKNPDRRVRYEALKTLVHFCDPLAEKQLLLNLESQDREVLLETITLAVHCSSQLVLDRLTRLLAQGSLQQSDYELKRVIVIALGEAGRVEALPELARLLASRSLLHPVFMTRLKTDVIQSLEQYPPSLVRPLLQRLAGTGGEVARQAAQVLHKLTGDQP